MLDDVNAIFANMPTAIKSYVVQNGDDTYTIVLNSRLNRESNVKAYAHELHHIYNKDYDKSTSADLIEVYAHNDNST